MIIRAQLVEDEGGRGVNVTIGEHRDDRDPPLSDFPADLLSWAGFNKGDRVIEIRGAPGRLLSVDASAMLIAVPEFNGGAFGEALTDSLGDIVEAFRGVDESIRRSWTWCGENGWSFLFEMGRASTRDPLGELDALLAGMVLAFETMERSRRGAAALNRERP